MDGLSLVVAIEYEYKEILLVYFNTCKNINYKSLRKRVFKGGYYDMIQKGKYMGVNVYVTWLNLMFMCDERG